ncbi:MAG: hypothetical protein SF123_03175 [Chloroflexota bacterium]|nr:hypothetical protein [Chloroflexota bacterium]
MPRLLRLSLALIIALCGAVAVVRGVAAALPDGGQLAFVSADDLLLLDVASQLVINLTRRSPSGVTSAPQWSPDGSRIAFIIPGAMDIGVVEIPSLRLRNLTNTNNDNESTFVWSRDGLEIVYERRVFNTSTTEIYRTTLDGQRLRLFSSERRADDLIWSPDDTLIGTRFVMTSGIRFQLIAFDGSGGHEVSADAVPDWLGQDATTEASLAAITGEDAAGVSAYDERTIAFVCERDAMQSGTICLINADGNNIRTIFTSEPRGVPYHLAWRPP